jgi:hypothetical protein
MLLLAQNTEEGDARIALAENASDERNYQESQAFHNQLNQQLEAREPTQELYDISKMLADKDKEIEELQTELEEFVKQGESNNNKVVFLSSKFAIQIYDIVRINRTRGRPSDFNLEHDGHQITSVQEV